MRDGFQMSFGAAPHASGSTPTRAFFAGLLALAGCTGVAHDESTAEPWQDFAGLHWRPQAPHFAEQPDLHGRVVKVWGRCATVRLDADSAELPAHGWFSMAIHSAGSYFGELRVEGAFPGHVFGTFWSHGGGDILVGDAATCRTP